MTSHTPGRKIKATDEKVLIRISFSENNNDRQTYYHSADSSEAFYLTFVGYVPCCNWHVHLTHASHLPYCCLRISSIPQF